MKTYFIEKATLRRLRKFIDTWKGLEDDYGCDHVVWTEMPDGDFWTLEAIRDDGSRKAILRAFRQEFNRSEQGVRLSLVIAMQRHSLRFPETFARKPLGIRKWEMLPYDWCGA